MAPNAVAEELARLRGEWKRLQAALTRELDRAEPDTRRCTFLRDEGRAVLSAIVVLERVQASLRAFD